MNKGWLVLEQSFFTPPEYASQNKAGGKSNGDPRLGDVVPIPKGLYPILTRSPLPVSTPDMRISSSQFCEFSWDMTKSHEGDVTVGSGTPIANAVGATINAEIKAEFRRNKTPLLDRWAVHVIIGLIIARVSGTVGNCTSSDDC
ncbi:hypothetical protein IWW34DRAFT_773241 [Fusarium oxysporum f. sp. albedinis]|nr:hypothetical protein IWW34DRAFT_773241 [Fusarium oxysporum f. sp. albedinis]